MENNKKLLKDSNGKISSKRVAGFILMFTCIFMGFIEQIFGQPINNIVFLSFATSFTALLGITVAEKLRSLIK